MNFTNEELEIMIRYLKDEILRMNGKGYGSDESDLIDIEEFFIAHHIL